MAATRIPERDIRRGRSHRMPVAASILAACLFLLSSALQVTASLQRWVIFRGSLSSEDRSAEDHLYDYAVPAAPWEPIHNAAQLYGIGALLTAAGVLVMPVGVGALTRFATKPAIVIGEIALVLLIAGSFAVRGARAGISGANGYPVQPEGYGALELLGIIGLLVLAVRWRSLPSAAVACLALLGSTGVGFVVSAFLIAPVFAGGVSHDTTPWTETVVAATTAVAGIAMIVAARAATRTMRRSDDRSVEGGGTTVADR